MAWPTFCFAQAPERVANIQTVYSIRMPGESTVKDKRYRFVGLDSLAGRWRFAVRSGGFPSRVLHETMPIAQRLAQPHTGP